MDRQAGVIAPAILAGILLFGIAWGLLLDALALIGVILVAGLAGQVIAGERVRAGWVFPAGLAGALFALAAVGFLGLPPLVRLGGVPVVWTLLGATASLVAASALAGR